MDKIITVFDIDDVFWPLNEHVAVIAGIDYKKIVTFRAKDNPLLDAAARQRLHDAYQTPRLHADMDFYPGAELFGVLARDPRIDPWLCSNSIDTDVISDKKRNMHLFLGTDYDRFRTMYNIISMEKSGEKKFPDGVRILIDDSPLNAVASGAGIRGTSLTGAVTSWRQSWTASDITATRRQRAASSAAYWIQRPDRCRDKQIRKNPYQKIVKTQERTPYQKPGGAVTPHEKPERRFRVL